MKSGPLLTSVMLQQNSDSAIGKNKLTDKPAGDTQGRSSDSAPRSNYYAVAIWSGDFHRDLGHE